MLDAAAHRALGSLLRRVLLPAGDEVFRQGMMARLRYLEAAQWWDRSRVLEEQRRQLLRLVQTAYREVPYYRARMDEVGVRPEDIRGPEDLPRIPLSTKTDLRAAYPDRLRRETGLAPYEVSTSGSTGANFYTLYDSQVEGRTRAATVLAMEWAGFQLGEPHLQTGMTLERDWPRRLKDLALRCHYVSAYQLDDRSVDAMLDALERHHLAYAFGYAASLHRLAERALETGRALRLKALVSWGDAMFPHYRALIERAFGAPVYDTYGIGEGMQIAAQCGHGPHYHVHDLDVLVEYVDDEGDPVPPGQPGALLLTRLHPGPMPLIRYRVGDTAAPSRNTSCACGRAWSQMEGLRGRECDVILTRTGNRLIVHFFTGLLEHFKEIESFQAVQTEAGAMTLKLKLVDGARLDADLRARVERVLTDKGADLAIEQEAVAEIPLTAGGKRRFVLSSL